MQSNKSRTTYIYPSVTSWKFDHKYYGGFIQVVLIKQIFGHRMQGNLLKLKSRPIQINYNNSENLLRHERDTCINNLKVNLNVSSTKADYFRSSKSNRLGDQHPINPEAQERKRRSFKEKYTLGSLDNVSKISWEENNLDEQSTLRRTRSFAISRENLFYSLDYTDTTENKKRRAQLIPRAKLIEKAFIKDSRYESFIIENRVPPKKKVSNQPPEIPPDYSPLPKSNSQKNFPLDGNIYDIPPVYTSRENSPVREDKGYLDADFEKKISDNSRYRRSLEDLVGLNLPNYYPDSELTDNISITDNQSTFSHDKGKYFSLDNIPWTFNEQPESISYDENIVLAKKSEGHYAKPRTLRGPTPYHSFDYAKLPQFSSGKVKKSEEKARDNQPEQHSSLEFETNTNCDEIKLNNDNITKNDSDKESAKLIETEIKYSVHEIIDKLKIKADLSCVNSSAKPLKTEAEKQKNKQVIDVESPTNHKAVSEETLNAANTGSNNQIKTLIEVCSAKTAVQDTDKSEDFKTIVSVEAEKSDISDNHEEESKSHSHNYLKEFLETQKGSKKPLQSFLAKKFSNLTRRHCKSNLVSNQFYSLPDITASKNLQKCERIDQKLRKCDKIVAERTENRFIVNIGKHFDITAKSSIPVDFQVKIAKVPKKNKKQNKNKDREKEFKDAVKNVNTTLQNNSFTVDLNNNDTKDINIDVKNTKSLEVKKDIIEDMDPEIQEKLDNMRNYWTKIAGNDIINEKCDEEKDHCSPQCKIIEVQTKVSNVKKKFEPVLDINEEKPPNKVQLAKQLFEPKPIPEKIEKLSPIIKETCRYFENNSPDRQNNGYESLCPTSVEIVSQTSENPPNNEFKEIPSTQKSSKPKKTLTKSNSISIPEFDHVRYKVIKPDLFNKKILANCESESQFDGLMQYLQDYSFQELLIDNNIVIIEPIRSKIPHCNSKSRFKNPKPGNNILVPACNKEGEFDDVKQGIRKHFFYHPIRVNKEVNDDELPNPEVVRQARQFFEQGLIKSQSTEKMSLEKEQYRETSTDPDKDKCSTSDSHSDSSSSDVPENMYDSLDNNMCFDEYVSEDILEKIREYGTTVTYYGGKIVDRQNGQPILTKVIMEEIKDIEKRCIECKGCRKNSIDIKLSEVSNDYQGIKFKLVKSNSCSSRLELVGAATKRDMKKKTDHKKNNKITIEKNNNSIKELDGENENKLNVKKGTDQYPDKNAINENIKQNNNTINQPRIIGEERKNPDKNKYIQWSEISNDQTYATIQFSKKTHEKIKNYDYQEKITPAKKTSEMEFEPYEVA